MKIVSIVGARPQFIKAATLSRVLRPDEVIQEILLHTGQHYDENMSDVFFRELNIPIPDYNLEVGSGSHAEQTGMMLKGIEEILIKEKPDCTLVYGDTNSTLAGALAASKLHIPVAHIEAGLRSFNRAMPEEINRIVTDHISDLLFAPTQTAIDNLNHEGLADITCFTGDVMFDSVLYYQDWIRRDPAKYKTPGIPPEYLLTTIHRAENTDNRTRKILQVSFPLPGNVHIIDPVGYLQMMKLTMDAAKVMTDSGGLQKEAYFLKKQCITLRTETEWIETLHDQWNIVTGSDPELIEKAVKSDFPIAPQRPGFGNGKSAEMITEKLLLFLNVNC
jgi:UDP-GlcNAc3NAcA epimerase